MTTNGYDMTRPDDEEAYASLADEMNDDDAPAWNEDDWDAGAVRDARAYAIRTGLRFPPGCGDYDRYAERKWNA